MHIPFVYCCKNIFASLKHLFSYFCLASSFFNGSSPTTNGNNLNWRGGMDRCKSNGFYLMGNINLTNIVSACQNFHNSPRWIGVVKESYISNDPGKENSKA